MVVAWLYIIVMAHQTELLKFMHFIDHLLHLSKVKTCQEKYQIIGLKKKNHKTVKRFSSVNDEKFSKNNI